MALVGAIWCGRLHFVWVELEPPALWLDPAAVMDAMLSVACCNSTSEISPKVVCSKPSMILGRFWVVGWFWAEGWGKASSPDRERCWLSLLGGIVKGFSGLEHDRRQILGFNSRRLFNPKHEGDETNEGASEGSGACGRKSKCKQ
jgi:hypothetical protein